MRLEFDPATHTYRLDGNVVPSVTKIIAPLEAEALARIPHSILEHKRQIGTAVHLACQLYDEGELDESTVAPEIAGYFAAYKKFLAEHPCEWVAVEVPMASKIHRFAGTPDRVGTLIDHNFMSVVDIKTRLEIGPTIGVQLAGYEKLIRESQIVGKTEPLSRLSLQLNLDGTYELHPFTHNEDMAIFTACLALWNWRAKHAA